MKFKYTIPLLLLSILGCNPTDDVMKIFTGKTWKLNHISTDKGDCTREYFSSQAQWDASMKLLSERGNFVISFTGAEINGTVTGTYSGRAANNTFSGKWEANGKNNTFRTNQADPAANEDLLGKVFINALKNAYKYEGDTNGNLTIHFKENNASKYLLLYAN
ncbi:MAG: DUF4847 family protein [Mediterranea sp.]|jgi:type IV secretory pathway ATPase VirB11/archaellum biosynthesis ATPase|nr:DUF4847 family protein [Mediterranea sp.]